MARYLTDLPTALRNAGLTVKTSNGANTRGYGKMTAVQSIIIHHTATPQSASGDYPTLNYVRDKKLSQLGLGRDGTWYYIAAGLCYHAGKVHSNIYANSRAIGIEAEHPGGKQPWPEVQYRSYVKGVAALAKHYGVPISRIQGHKEVAIPRGRKSDPNFDMHKFRADVEREMKNPSASTAAPEASGTFGNGGLKGQPASAPGALNADDVKALQAFLKVPVDGWFEKTAPFKYDIGKKTTRALQQHLYDTGARFVKVDGDLGEQTVKGLQQRLNHVVGPVQSDGDWGQSTTDALRRALAEKKF